MKDLLKDRVIAAIGGEYDVGEELGRGGMSVVYRALDLRLMRQVAIKVLPPEFAYDEGIRERFRREAQMAAQLSHPHIIPIFSVDDKDGVVYFAMAVCEGESLALRLARTSRPPLDDVRRILAEVAGALAYAHGKGVVHRDIKPDNILIERDTGRSFVTDFGIARAAEGGARLTVTGIAMGTPAYMSPEQAMGEHELDGRSDVYSLGALAYQMVSGVTPYSATNAPSMLLKHVSEELVPLVQRRHDVPPGLAAIIERALQKKRELRWQTAAEMHDALRHDMATPQQRREPAPPPAAYRSEASDRSGSSERQGLSRDRGSRASGASAGVGAGAGGRTTTPRGAYVIPRGDGQGLDRRWDGTRDKGGDWFDVMRREQNREISEKIGMLRFLVPFTAVFGAISTFLTLLIIAEGPPPEEWAIIWLMTLAATATGAVGILRRRRWLRARGISFWAALRSRKTVSYSPEIDRIPQPRELPVPFDVMDGPFGLLVRKAMQDRDSIEATIASLPAVDRKLLPEVLPTVKALADRVFTLAPTLHDLDRDLQREDIARLEQRIAELANRRDSESNRTLQLLRRQHATLVDLTSRRDTLLSQIESAALLLQNIKLDLRKIGSSGLQASMHDVNSATQEARALSREIGHVLSAADDLKRM